jgi:tRNA(Arg) A34 adenosine deaminase TadA
MCSSVINESRIDKVYYLFDQDGIINNNFIKIDSNSEYKNKINELFNEFFRKMRG